MIELRHIGFSYERERILHNIDLTFARGELCAIVGPNGCGKTTLLKLIGRLQEPAEGEILLNARPLSQYDRKEFARNVALMPQTRPVPEMTVGEYVANGRYPYLAFAQKMSRADEEAVSRALETADVARFSQRSLSELSGGERQRAYLALLLAQDTECVLLDEPTTYLDLSAQFAVMQIMQKMRDAGKCVIVVLHDLGMALQYCDRIVVMQNGSVAAVDTPNALAASEIWNNVFDVRCVPVDQENMHSFLFQPKK